MRSAQINVGCVHGRFQPFHLGHLEYVAQASELCEVLYVGLANSDPSHVDEDPSAPHRHRVEANPFAYFERMEMVLGSLVDCGVDVNRLRVVPFPINRPHLLKHYVPIEAVQLITIYDAWGETKFRVLEALGYKLEIMWRRETKFTTGSEVRRRLKDGLSIIDLVPGYVNGYLKQRGHQKRDA